MRKISIEGGPAVMLVCCATSSLTQAPFKRAEVSSAPGIRNPVESFADGVVVPDVSLDDRGAITGNSVVRDNHFLNSAATSETPAGISAMLHDKLSQLEPSLGIAVVLR